MQAEIELFENFDNIIKRDVGSNNISHCYLLESVDTRALEVFSTVSCFYLLGGYDDVEYGQGKANAFEDVEFGQSRGKKFEDAEFGQKIKKVDGVDINDEQKTINSNEEDGMSLLRQKVFNNSHADILRFPIKDKTFTAAEFEILEENLYFAPMEAELRIIVIKDFDKTSERMQNRLLKVLEEPPKKTVILLLVARVSNVLQTIISRSRTVTIPRLKCGDIGNFIFHMWKKSSDENALWHNDDESERKNYKNFLNASVIGSAALFCDGRLDNALDYAFSGKISLIEESIWNFFINCQNSKYMLQYSKILQSFQNNFSMYFSIWIKIVEMLIVASGGGRIDEPDRFIGAVSRKANIAKVLENYSLQALIDCLDTLKKALRGLEMMCNKVTLCDMLIMDMLIAKAKHS